MTNRSTSLVTFNLELDSHTNSKGESILMIRCSQNRIHKRINSGIRVIPKYWDNAKKQVKKFHPLHHDLNKTINLKFQEVQEKYLSLLREEEPVTMFELVSKVQQPRSVNFFEFARTYKLNQFKNNKKLGTLRRYESVLAKFSRYAGKDLTINQINYSLLTGFEEHLLQVLKNGRDTVSSNLSVLRTILKDAIRHDLFTKKNPFDSLTLRYTNNTKHKLTIEELQSFATVALPLSPSVNLARDFFVACFYAAGCRGGDMVLMKWSNIKDNTICYTQQKTGKKMILPLLPELKLIFNKYKTTYRDHSNYIFPLLDDVKVVNEIVTNSKLTYINKYLKEVCKYAGIFKNISTHCARHTFSDISLSLNNNDIYGLRDVLGHSSVKITEKYLLNRNYVTGGNYLKSIEDLPKK